ncbi:MAG: hypothetical protein JO166_01950 [Deltaproteobacteria bacterium]|nr:hypothetical protein [Deltaproteobacteria bacterium]
MRLILPVSSRYFAAVLLLTWASACASTSERMQPLKSVQALQYYPFLVKGYENTYPNRRVMVLSATDARDFKDNSGVAHVADKGNPAIGVIRDRSGEIIQRLYGPALQPLVQQSITQAAKEAGMSSFSSNLGVRAALSSHQAQYVIASKIARFWVDKHRGPDNAGGPTWSSTAEVALDVVVYKVPFDVPFWQGESSATYDDPPAPVAGAAPEDETEIYDDPGEVLSVGLTRATAGIFKRDDLHTLITEDSPPTTR